MECWSSGVVECWDGEVTQVKALKFSFLLDLEQKSSVIDGH